MRHGPFPFAGSIFAFLVLVACGSTSGSPPAASSDDAAAPGTGDDAAAAGDGGAPTDGGKKPIVDLAGPLYDPNHIVEVSITMSPADWEVLRNETRSFGSVVEGSCLAQPIASPFTTFEAVITVDGTTIPHVGIHKKGFFGSLDVNKPSLKVTLDEYTAEQKYLSIDKLTLNNSRQDPSYVRQCLTYPVFAATGSVTPRCNFAHVRVNGKDLGVYVNVESTDRKMMKKRYADGTGNLYEGTLSDFRPNWVNTFDPKGSTPADHADLIPMVTALQTATDANLVATVDPLLDVDRFMNYWATEIITNHWDGYANNTNNFYVYHDPTSKKLHFIPWGVDGAMQPGATFGNLGAATGPVAITANGFLASRLFANAATKKTILDRERALLGTAWKEASLLAEIDRMEKLITPIADPIQGAGWHTAVSGVRVFVNERRAKLTAALDAGPTWTDPLKGYPCVDVKATVQGTFATTYGTLSAANPLGTGSGTFSITIGGVKTVLTPVGATSGLDPNSPPGTPRSLVQIYGQRASDGHIIVTAIGLRSAGFLPRFMNIGFFDGNGAVYDYNPVTMTTTLLGTLLGDLTLTQASTAAGAPVVGSFGGNADKPGTPP